MYKLVLLGILLFFSSFSANASFLGAIEAIANLFKSAKASTEAAAEARHARKAVDAAQDMSTGSKVLGHAPEVGAVRPIMENAVSKTSDLNPNFSSEVRGRSSRDIETYKSLRNKARNGDSGAMLQMSDLTRSGQINDPGEPHYGYWLFEAMRSSQQVLHGTQVISKSIRDADNFIGKKAQDVCKNETDLRRSNRLFDNECSLLDTKHYFAGSGSSSQFIDQLQKKQTAPKSEKSGLTN